VFDVAADLRPNSPIYGQWVGVELSSTNLGLVYLPEGVAHGFQSLVDDAELTYHISARYAPEAQDGVAWNDPDLAVQWPDPKRAIPSAHDLKWQFLREFRPLLD
jgi:dTDP-4-dehydrorhamnose 3,5-epimerase